MWTMNFQMFKLVLEKTEEPEIKLPTSVGSLKKQESSRKKIYFCFIDYAKAIDSVEYNKLWKILQEMGIPDHLLKNFPQFGVIHTVKGFGTVNKTEVDVFSGTLLLFRWASANSNSAFKWVYPSFSPLLFASLLFTAICKASSDSHFAFWHFFFLGMVLITASYTMSWTSVHSSSGTLFIKSNPLNLFVPIAETNL